MHVFVIFWRESCAITSKKKLTILHIGLPVNFLELFYEIICRRKPQRANLRRNEQ